MSHKVVFFFSFFSLFFFFVFCLWFFCLIQIERASPGYSNQLVNESSMMTVIFLFVCFFSIIKKLPWGPPMSRLMAVEIVYRCFLSKLFSCFLPIRGCLHSDDNVNRLTVIKKYYHFSKAVHYDHCYCSGFFKKILWKPWKLSMPSIISPDFYAVCPIFR